MFIYLKKKQAIEYILKTIKKKSNIILSGGQTIQSLLKYLNANNNLRTNKVLLSDERLVKFNSKLRNDIFFKKLIKKKIITKKFFFNFNSEFNNQKYLTYFNKKISKIIFKFAILGLGKNNHVASIFDTRNINKKNFFFVHNSPKKPKDRVSVSINLLLKCNKIIIVANKYRRLKEINNLENSEIYKLIKKKIFKIILV